MKDLVVVLIQVYALEMARGFLAGVKETQETGLKGLHLGITIIGKGNKKYKQNAEKGRIIKGKEKKGNK